MMGQWQRSVARRGASEINEIRMATKRRDRWACRRVGEEGDGCKEMLVRMTKQV